MWTTIAHSAPDTVYRLKLPESIAKVSSRWKADKSKSGAEKTVVHIQDAHDSLRAQVNIAETIKHLSEEEDVSLIGVEGGVGDIPIQSFRDFSVKSGRDRAAKDYMQKGYFSGAEYAGITSEQDLNLYGVESEQAFKDNFKANYDLNKASTSVNTLRRVNEYFLSLRHKILNTELLDFMGLVIAYNSNSDAFDRLLIRLLSEFDSQYLDISEFPQIMLLAEQAEQKASQSARKLCTSDLDLLIREIEKAAYVTSIRLCKSEFECDYIKKIEMIRLLLKAADLKILNYEFTELKRNFSIEKVSSFIRNTLESFPCEDISAVSYFKTAIAEVYANAESFYDSAESRDQEFVDNLLARMSEEKEDTAVLVTGGYHSAGVERLLRERNVNYLTVMPNMEGPDEQLPFDALMSGKLFPIRTQLTGTLRGLTLYIHNNLTGLKVDFENDALLRALELITSGNEEKEEIESQLKELENMGELGEYTADEEKFYELVRKINTEFSRFIDKVHRDNGTKDYSLDDVNQSLRRLEYQDEFAKLQNIVRDFFEKPKLELENQIYSPVNWKFLKRAVFSFTVFMILSKLAFKGTFDGIDFEFNVDNFLRVFGLCLVSLGKVLFIWVFFESIVLFKKNIRVSDIVSKVFDRAIYRMYVVVPLYLCMRGIFTLIHEMGHAYVFLLYEGIITKIKYTWLEGQALFEGGSVNLFLVYPAGAFAEAVLCCFLLKIFSSRPKSEAYNVFVISLMCIMYQMIRYMFAADQLRGDWAGLLFMMYPVTYMEFGIFFASVSFQIMVFSFVAEQLIEIAMQLKKESLSIAKKVFSVVGIYIVTCILLFNNLSDAYIHEYKKVQKQNYTSEDQYMYRTYFRSQGDDELIFDSKGYLHLKPDCGEISGMIPRYSKDRVSLINDYPIMFFKLKTSSAANFSIKFYNEHGLVELSQVLNGEDSGYYTMSNLDTENEEKIITIDLKKMFEKEDLDFPINGFIMKSEISEVVLIDYGFTTYETLSDIDNSDKGQNSNIIAYDILKAVGSALFVSFGWFFISGDVLFVNGALLAGFFLVRAVVAGLAEWLVHGHLLRGSPDEPGLVSVNQNNRIILNVTPSSEFKGGRRFVAYAIGLSLAFLTMLSASVHESIHKFLKIKNETVTYGIEALLLSVAFLNIHPGIVFVSMFFLGLVTMSGSKTVRLVKKIALLMFAFMSLSLPASASIVEEINGVEYDIYSEVYLKVADDIELLRNGDLSADEFVRNLQIQGFSQAQVFNDGERTRILIVPRSDYENNDEVQKASWENVSAEDSFYYKYIQYMDIAELFSLLEEEIYISVQRRRFQYGNISLLNDSRVIERLIAWDGGSALADILNKYDSSQVSLIKVLVRMKDVGLAMDFYEYIMNTASEENRVSVDKELLKSVIANKACNRFDNPFALDALYYRMMFYSDPDDMGPTQKDMLDAMQSNGLDEEELARNAGMYTYWLQTVAMPANFATDGFYAKTQESTDMSLLAKDEAHGDNGNDLSSSNSNSDSNDLKGVYPCDGSYFEQAYKDDEADCIEGEGTSGIKKKRSDLSETDIESSRQDEDNVSSIIKVLDFMKSFFGWGAVALFSLFSVMRLFLNPKQKQSESFFNRRNRNPNESRDSFDNDTQVIASLEHLKIVLDLNGLSDEEFSEFVGEFVFNAKKSESHIIAVTEEIWSDYDFQNLYLPILRLFNFKIVIARKQKDGGFVFVDDNDNQVPVERMERVYCFTTEASDGLKAVFGDMLIFFDLSLSKYKDAFPAIVMSLREYYDEGKIEVSDIVSVSDNDELKVEYSIIEERLNAVVVENKSQDVMRVAA